MDDCNGCGAGDIVAAVGVQIPLWTIVTQVQLQELEAEMGSDSSMDDCNPAPAIARQG